MSKNKFAHLDNLNLHESQLYFHMLSKAQGKDVELPSDNPISIFQKFDLKTLETLDFYPFPEYSKKILDEVTLSIRIITSVRLTINNIAGEYLKTQLIGIYDQFLFHFIMKHNRLIEILDSMEAIDDSDNCETGSTTGYDTDDEELLMGDIYL